jgi:hypothetical protein
MTPVSTRIAAGKLSGRWSRFRLVCSWLATISPGERFARHSLAILCVLCASLTFSVGVAGAEAPGIVGDGYFPDSDNPAGVAVDNSCYVQGLSAGACSAADPSNGDVYATDLNAPTEQGIDKFDASGDLLSPPSPFGAGIGLYGGAAVNPTNGDVDVMGNDVFNRALRGGRGAFEPEIETYDPSSGALLSSFMVPDSGNAPIPYDFKSLVQIASDSAGNVYVPVVPGNEVLEYEPSACPAVPEPCTPLKTFTGSGASALSKPTGVAVAASGNVWVADKGNNRIEELSPSGAFVGEIKSEGVESLALDAHGDVFALVVNSADDCEPIRPPCEHLVEYSSSGAQIADVGAGFFGVFPGEDNEGSTVAVDDESGRVYVSDGKKNRVWVYQPPVAPVLGQESAVEVGTSEAKLGAVVNPGGAGTTYRFEYDTREYNPGEGSHGVSVPFPEGSAGEGFSSRTVWASAGGLAPGTTYHYRVVATNGVGTAVGPDQTFTTVTAAQAACPNEQARGGFSAALPDCRAYELVSPVSKDTAEPDPQGKTGDNYAASNGDRFSYTSNEALPGAQSAGINFIATRGASGWSTESALPLAAYTGDRCPWVAQEDTISDYSADLSKSVININHKDTYGSECSGEAVEVVPGEPLSEENLLLRDNGDGGSYQLINLTPAGVTPTPVSLIAASADLNLVVFSERAKLTSEALNNTENLYEWSEGVVRLLKLESPSGARLAGTVVSISENGSDVFFTAGGSLYVRLNGGERTVQLDEARGGPGPGGGGALAAVSAEGSEVFFTDNATAGLTGDTQPGSGTNLYSYDVSTAQLSDLTPVSGAEAGLKGISEDGSYVYFSSKGVLSGSTQRNQFGETAQNGQSNLYLEHGGTITFLMHGGGGAISANGAFFLTNGYLYSAAANRFVPTGVNLGYTYFLSNNGQVFFETREALLPRDTNGVGNVYEFDYESGLHLISTGTSSSGDKLAGASPSGDDVFFLTRQSLLPQSGSNEASKIYDARVDGGFLEPALAPACTTADACRSASSPQPAIYGAPSSQTFSGAGNVSEAPSIATVKAKALTRSQKLANALKACKKAKSKSKRSKCEKTARKRYGAAQKSTAKRSSDDRRASR